MNELENILEESVARVFAEQIDNDVLAGAETTPWPDALWDTVTELGLPHVLVAEDAGGMGGSWSAAHIVVRRAGYAALPLPVPEAIVAHWLAHRAETPLAPGPIGLILEPLPSAAFGEHGYGGVAAGIPWGRAATSFVGISETGEFVVLAREGVKIECANNLGHEPRDSVAFEDTAVLARVELGLAPDAVRWLVALLRSAQIAGAGARCLETGVRFVGEREQFGRPLSRFQAIQHHLAVMAGALATVEAMSAAAFRAMDTRGIQVEGRDARFEIAAAKCRASDAVESLTRIAHQVHGAIGFTYEYGLHFLTRRLWAWRAECGGSAEWSTYLGEIAQRVGGDGVWPYLTD